MKRFHDEFLNNVVIKLEDVNFDELSFEERFWLLACKCSEYHQAKEKYLATLCMTRIKELTFLWACSNRVNKCGFLDEKYKEYSGTFEFPPSNDKLIMIDRDLSGMNKRKLKYELASYLVIVFCVAVICLLYLALDVNMIISIGIGAVISLIFNSLVLPYFARRMKKKPEPIVEVAVPEELKKLIAYDEKLNDIIKEKDYQPLLAAKNEAELNDAIRKYPKK